MYSRNILPVQRKCALRACAAPFLPLYTWFRINYTRHYPFHSQRLPTPGY
jgi:hypothetical protein